MRRPAGILLLCLFAAMAAMPAQAKRGDPLDDMNQYTLGLIKGMSVEQMQYVYEVRSRHGIIRSVRVIRGDVSNAIDACSKTQPDMAADLAKRFESWDQTVSPILDEADANLKTMITAQQFTSSAKIQKMLDLVEKAFKFTESKMEKKPVTSKEGCTYLADNMSDTQKKLAKLLKETLVSVPPPPAKSEAPPEEKPAAESKPDEDKPSEPAKAP